MNRAALALTLTAAGLLLVGFRHIDATAPLLMALTPGPRQTPEAGNLRFTDA